MSPEIVIVIVFIVGMIAGIIVSTINILVVYWIHRSIETRERRRDTDDV